MDPWGTPALTGYSCKDFPSRTTKEHQLLRKKKAKYLTWNSVRLKFVKKVSMSNSVKSLGCIKYYSLSSPRLVKSTNCIRHNCQKICRWSRRSKTILEIRKNTTFLKEINNPIIYKFFKDATNERRITRRIVCIEVSAPLKNTIPLSCRGGGGGGGGCIVVSAPLKNTIPLSCQAPPPSLLNQQTFQAHPFLGNLPTSILVFREPPPPP